MKRVLAFIMLLVSSTTGSYAADSAEVVKGLLDKGWGNTVEARKFPNYDSLKNPPLSADSSVQAARWLVLMYQNRYDEALTSLEAFPKAQPSDDLSLAALHAATWLRTIKQEYPQALVQADKLAQAATPNPPAKKNDLVQAQDEAIAFLGNIVGFLEGPCAKSADQNTRAKFEERFMQRLDEPRKKVFADAKAATLAKFNALSAELDAAKAKSQQTAEAERQKDLANLDNDLQKLGQEETKLNMEKMQVRSTFDKNIAALDRQDLPLQQTLAGLQGQIAMATASATQAQTTVQNLQLQLNNAKNAPNGPQLQNDLRQANNNLQTARNLLDQFNNQAAGIIRQRKMIEQQKTVLDRNATAETNKIDKQLKNVDADKTKIERKIADVKKAKLGPGGAVLKLQADLPALTTYNEFPLETLRSKLLKQAQ